MVKKISLKSEYFPVLKTLQEVGRPIEAQDLCDKLGWSYEKVMSQAVYNLAQKGLAEYTEDEVTLLKPTEEMRGYIENGLPERQIYELFRRDDRREVKLNDFQKEVEKELGFNKKFFFIGFGKMKKNRWVLTSKATGGQPSIFINPSNEDASPTEEEDLLVFLKDYEQDEEKEKYRGLNGIIASEIPDKFDKVIDTLYKRKLFNKEKMTLRIVKLTEKGKNIEEKDLNLIEKEIKLINSQMLKDGSWKENLNNLKSYDIEKQAPIISAGKYHPITIIINEIREIFHSMGFQEIRSPIIETAFFNFDSLYQPQDHPARELHDTFYLNNPITGKLPNKKYVNAVKETHENGWKTGSTGWKYDWSPEIAKKCLLRTHTTAATVRQLKDLAKDTSQLPKKVFCIDRVFRNEKVDKTHLAEFQQIEGIVIGKNVTLCDLIGQLVEFYKKMGFKKVVTRPGFFPYTEPSMEISVYSEELGAWLEMGGSGVFRPEVTYPWGIREPVRVLAWGMGLERLAMLKLKRNDIRDLYQSPIPWLREVSY